LEAASWYGPVFIVQQPRRGKTANCEVLGEILSNYYGAQLQERLDQLNLTIYGASQIVGAETDEPLLRVNERIRQYLKADPKTLRQFAEVIEALGGKLEINWKD
jgi:hypothetical protein